MMSCELDYILTVVEVLENVSNSKFPEWWDYDIGLCNQSWNLCVDFKKYETDCYYSLTDVIKNHVEDWDEYSGNINYPVKSPRGLTPFDEYVEVDNYYYGTYGESRKRLAQFLSEKLKEV